MLHIFKRIASLLVICAMLCGVAGCGSNTSKFDFDEAMKDITLFGQKISLPCYRSDFGEDFSHDELYDPSDDDLMGNLLYKGEKSDISFSETAPTPRKPPRRKATLLCAL